MRRDGGYTLLEISVVVTIIGLIIGGIVAAQAMTRASQLQNMVAEYGIYIKSVGEFRDKFLAMPGDFNQAESMWGSDTTCPNTPTNTVLKKATCNGDANGSIGNSDFSGNMSATREWFRAWQQLADAGYIPGLYSGTPGPGGVMEAVPGVNVPSSSIQGGGWTLNYFLLTSTNANLWGDQYGHILNYGAYSAGTYTIGPVLRPDEAMAIDVKIDDGKPGRGIVRAWRTNLLPNCTINDGNQDNAAYGTSNSQACSLIFILGY